LEATSDAGFSSVSCTGSSDCVCNLLLTPTTTNETGTYATSGGVITQTKAGGTPDDAPYCVQGKTLTLSPNDADMTTTSGAIVLTKQ
ncbi:MAG TPA: hypothetical protein VEQ59_08540, partial [Polyangiaceae bacterium]|nr:hypothetical protein [Polyangiaceae bacterium]